MAADAQRADEEVPGVVAFVGVVVDQGIAHRDEGVTLCAVGE